VKGRVIDFIRPYFGVRKASLMKRTREERQCNGNT
jgi:hypothetical protein